MTADTPQPPVVLFDGVCNLCNGLVNFVLDHERRPEVRFAALQSEAGQRLLREHGLPTDELNSMVLVEEGAVYRRSAAAVRVTRYLRWPWRAFRVFWFVPRPLRDLGYGLIARNRYRLFGQSDTCRMPTPELRERFLR